MELYKSRLEIKNEENSYVPEWLRILDDYITNNYEKGSFPHYKSLKYKR